jgi:hypothetical protein
VNEHNNRMHQHGQCGCNHKYPWQRPNAFGHSRLLASCTNRIHLATMRVSGHRKMTIRDNKLIENANSQIPCSRRILCQSLTHQHKLRA